MLTPDREHCAFCSEDNSGEFCCSTRNAWKALHAALDTLADCEKHPGDRGTPLGLDYQVDHARRAIRIVLKLIEAENRK